MQNTNFPSNSKYFSTVIEHTIVIDRPDGSQLNLAVQHFGTCQEVDLSILGGTQDEPEVKEQVILTFEEARLLRNLLLRPEVSAYLDKE